MISSKTVIFLLLISLSILSGCQNTEDSPPVPGVITHFTDVTSNSMVMHWTRASDGDTFQPYLEYMVLASNRNNLDTLENALKNGKVITYDDPETEAVESIRWNRDISSLYLSFVGFSDGNTYYFTVIVRDLSWRQSAYPMASQKTIDITAPTVGGEISIVNETDGSLSLDWPPATDNGTDQYLLEYKVIKSSRDDINTVAAAERNGIIVKDWATFDDIQVPLEISSPNTSVEYFNILVRDSATDVANIGIYESVDRRPRPGGLGKVTADDITTNTCRLTWEAATDFKTEQADLEYQIVRSGLDSPILTWTKNITEYDVSGLNSDTAYSFAVSVRDSDGFTVSYSRVRVETLPVEESATQKALDRGRMSLTEEESDSICEAGAGRYEASATETNLPIAGSTAQAHLMVWLDASDVTGTGTVVPGPVSIWKDKSGLGNHAEQAVSGKKPVILQSPLFGDQYVVRFDADNQQCMRLPLGEDLMISPPFTGYTIFMVSRVGSDLSTGTGIQRCYFVGSDGTSDRIGMFHVDGEDGVNLLVNNGPNTLLDVSNPVSPFVASLAVAQTDDRIEAKCRVNGQTYSLPGVVHPKPLREFVLGASSIASEAGSETAFFTGDLAEFFVFDTMLSDHEIELMHHYLNEKWGINPLP